MSDDLNGKKLGQYQIKTKIGEGGMAVVYKAFQPGLERDVAVKVLPRSFAQKPLFKKRFEREARSIARLKHPNILPVYDTGVEQGYSYIVMQFVESGQTLERVMKQPLSQDRIIELISQIGQALAYAHAQGVIHRDLKPSNVLIESGWPLLSDFGLAKLSEASTDLTGSDARLGTPSYMSPEQCQGIAVDQRTDIYALGVILYQMLTGTVPHKADTPITTMFKRINEPPPSPRTINPEIPISIEQVVLRVLAVKPENRYQNATDFVTALQAAAVDEDYREFLPDEEPTVASTAPVPIVPSKQRPILNLFRHPVLVATVGIILSIGGMWGGWRFLNAGSAEPNATPTVSLVANIPTATDTPTSLPSSTPTPTFMPTSTPSLTPTPSPIPPSPTPIVVTATSTNSPTPSPTPEIPTATAIVPSTATPSLPEGNFNLLNPISLDEPTYGPTIFEWQWAGDVPVDKGFEIRVWRDGEAPAGAHDSVLDNLEGRIESIGESKYRLNIDISDAAGVMGQSGIYSWTVGLVQIDPNWVDLDYWAEPAHLRYEAPGPSGSGSSSSSSNGGGSGGGIN